MSRWQLFFSTLEEIGQVKQPVDLSKVITNEFIAPANDFDKAQVKADAEGRTLSAEVAAVDLDAIKERFFANVVR